MLKVGYVYAIKRINSMLMAFFKHKKQHRLQLLREQTIKRISYLTYLYMSVYGNDTTHIGDFMKAQYVNELIRRI